MWQKIGETSQCHFKSSTIWEKFHIQTKISIFLKYGILCTGLETDKIKGSVFVLKKIEFL